MGSPGPYTLRPVHASGGRLPRVEWPAERELDVALAGGLRLRNENVPKFIQILGAIRLLDIPLNLLLSHGSSRAVLHYLDHFVFFLNLFPALRV